VRIRSTIQGSGTKPSIICARGQGSLGQSGAGSIGNNNGFSPVNLFIKNIQFQITTNGNLTSGHTTTMCAVNGEKAVSSSYYNTHYMPHNCDWLVSAQPTFNVIGLICSGTQNSAICEIDGCSVTGAYYGILSGEHMVAGYNTMHNCYSAWGIAETRHLVHLGRWEAASCKWYAEKVGGSYQTPVWGICGTEQDERTTGTEWFKYAGTINDPNNLLYGDIIAHIQSGWGVTTAPSASKVGGEGLRLKVFPTGATPSALYISHAGAAFTFSTLFEEQQTHAFSNATAIALTIPNCTGNGAVNYSIGAEIPCIQTGAGAIVPAGATGVTVTLPPGKTQSSGIGATLILRKVATNTWYVSGDLA
jgi:hypothetical protein